MNEILHRFLPQMTHEEKVELLVALKAAIADELAAPGAGVPSACPRCGCPRFVRKGYAADGSQRRLCHGCGQTFPHKTMGLLARSKLDAAAWMAFAECMADELSLREAAKRCGVSLYTAWSMRMRVCEVMPYRLLAPRPGIFQIDDTHFVKSLSGNHRRSTWYEMPRKPHRNGKDGRRKGGSKSKNRISVSCGINELGDCFCEVLSEGAVKGSDAGHLFKDKVPAASTVIADGDLPWSSAMKGACANARTIDPKDPRTGNINMANSLHSRLKEFMAPFHGVATRRMQRYLDWFCWREQFKKSDIDRRRLLAVHGFEGRYLYTRSLTHLEDRPFLPYYDRRRYAYMARHLHMVV